jgi:hypothetical protein
MGAALPLRLYLRLGAWGASRRACRDADGRFCLLYAAAFRFSAYIVSRRPVRRRRL